MTDYTLLVAPSEYYYRFAILKNYPTLSATDVCGWCNGIDILIKSNSIGTYFDLYNDDEVTKLPLPSLNIDEIKLLYPEYFI